jgi:hypothetical protein
MDRVPNLENGSVTIAHPFERLSARFQIKDDRKE